MSDNRMNFGSHITLPGMPEQPMDASPKEYVDARIDAFQWPSVVAAAEAPVSTSYRTGDVLVARNSLGQITGQKITLDGYEVQEGEFVLLWDQDVPKENGIYVVNYVMNGSVMEARLTRHPSANTPAKFAQGKTVFVLKQNDEQLYGGYTFRNMTKDPVTLSLSSTGTDIIFRPEEGAGGGGGGSPVLVFDLGPEQYANNLVTGVWEYRIQHNQGTTNLLWEIRDARGEEVSMEAFPSDAHTLVVKTNKQLFTGPTLAITNTTYTSPYVPFKVYITPLPEP